MLLRGVSVVISALTYKLRYQHIQIRVLDIINDYNYTSLFLFVHNGLTALNYAAMNGHTNVLSLLVEANADIN